MDIAMAFHGEWRDENIEAMGSKPNSVSCTVFAFDDLDHKSPLHNAKTIYSTEQYSLHLALPATVSLCTYSVVHLLVRWVFICSLPSIKTLCNISFLLVHYKGNIENKWLIRNLKVTDNSLGWKQQEDVACIMEGYYRMRLVFL